MLHPTNPDIAYVAAQGSVWGPGGDRGLYRTTRRRPDLDAHAARGRRDTGVTDVAMDWRDPGILYAASYQRRRSAFGFDGGGPGSALWKSTDAGATWTKLTGNGLPDGEYGRIGIAVYRKDPSIVVREHRAGRALQRVHGLHQPQGRALPQQRHAARTWTFMSDWNPRPMYASQPTIDPNDDQRIYMLNSYSYRDDGGKTFTAPAHDHAWRRPLRVGEPDATRRHVVKLDDGGIGI